MPREAPVTSAVFPERLVMDKSFEICPQGTMTCLAIGTHSGPAWFVELQGGSHENPIPIVARLDRGLWCSGSCSFVRSILAGRDHSGSRCRDERLRKCADGEFTDRSREDSAGQPLEGVHEDAV